MVEGGQGHALVPARASHNTTYTAAWRQRTCLFARFLAPSGIPVLCMSLCMRCLCQSNSLLLPPLVLTYPHLRHPHPISSPLCVAHSIVIGHMSGIPWGTVASMSRTKYQGEVLQRVARDYSVNALFAREWAGHQLLLVPALTIDQGDTTDSWRSDWHALLALTGACMC